MLCSFTESPSSSSFLCLIIVSLLYGRNRCFCCNLALTKTRDRKVGTFFAALGNDDMDITEKTEKLRFHSKSESKRRISDCNIYFLTLSRFYDHNDITCADFEFV